MSEDKSYTTEDLLLFIDKLRRENQQLKEQKENLTRMVCNKLLTDYDYSSPLKEELNAERLKNIVLKEANKLTNEENKQLKEVIEEVREYITEDLDEQDFEHCGDVIVEYEWFTDLLQILDKVKGEK